MARIFVLILLITMGPVVHGQDSLPYISVKNKSGKIILSWKNPHKDVVQINIQRSPDSVKGFKTILTVADPNAVTNGYLDNRSPDTKQFYRLYVQQEGGRYFFTNAYRAVPDTSHVLAKSNTTSKLIEKSPVPPAQGQTGTLNPLPPASAGIEETNGETGSYAKIERNGVPRKKLSNTQRVGLEPEKANVPEIQEILAPSVFVHTNPQGHVVVALPPEKTNQYTLKFFKEDGTPLFTMNKIRDHYLTIDKTNFIRSGWFRFELYENNALKEKNKFFIPKENF